MTDNVSIIDPQHSIPSQVREELMRAAEDWARGRGCREMASDTWIDNEDRSARMKRLASKSWTGA